MKPLYNVERFKIAGSFLPEFLFFYNGQICLTAGISFSLSGDILRHFTITFKKNFQVFNYGPYIINFLKACDSPDYTPCKLCLWWVYCFHVVRACVRPSVRNVLFP